MSGTAWSKVEDALKAVLDTQTGSGGTLEGWAVQTQQSADIAVEANTITIWTTTNQMDQSDEQHQTIHTPKIEIEFADDGQPSGVLGRSILEAAAAVHALIAADRTLGGRLQDIQEIDIAPAPPEGRDVASSSIQYQVEFYTPRDDWTTIVGEGGATF